MSDQPMLASRLPVTAEPERHSIRLESEAIDRAVGQRVRQLRVERGLGQEALAAEIGVTYQQLHKYEKGINRIAASRLYAIAQALGASIDAFFEPVDRSAGMRTRIEFMAIAEKVPAKRLGALTAVVRALGEDE